MAIVKINDDFRVQLIPSNLVLQKKNIIQDGDKKDEINWVTEGYYGEGNWHILFDTLVRHYVKLKIKKKEMVELKELRDIFIETKKEIKELLKDFV